MNSFTLYPVTLSDTIDTNEPRFYICSNCHAAYHGIRLFANACIKCTNGTLLHAVIDPHPPPSSIRYIVCDKCGFIITGRLTRKWHSANCSCITVHHLFKEVT